MHIRRAILESIRTQLQTLPDFSGVWIQRVPPTRNAYPCITLYANNENSETMLIHPRPRLQDRVVSVSVNAWIRITVDAEKAESDMDNAALLIEQAMNSDFGADDVRLVATDFQVDEEEPELHAATLTYEIDYTSTESNPISL